MRKNSIGKRVILTVLIIMLSSGSISCGYKELNIQNSFDSKKIELYLPKLAETYYSVYSHWNELDLEKVNLMEKPLLSSSDIEYEDKGELKVKKDIVIVNGTGLESSFIYDDGSDGVLKFEYEGKKYEVDKKSSSLFYYYTIYDICVVLMNDKIFLVKQKDFKKEKDSNGNVIFQREYKKGVIGIPYVLVINGKRTELGVLKVAEAEFAIPKSQESWCYMGPPEELTIRESNGKALRKVE